MREADARPRQWKNACHTIVLWHGLGPPASEGDLMSALPLDEVAAVKIYLGLPLSGGRAPSGDSASLAQRQTEDYASLIFEPVVFGAAQELPAVLGALRDRKCLAKGAKISLFEALRPFYPRSGNDPGLKLVIAPGVAHAWTRPPALGELQVAVANWFNRYL